MWSLLYLYFWFQLSSHRTTVILIVLTCTMEGLTPIMMQNYFPWETEKRQIGCAACRHSSENCLPKSKSTKNVIPLLANLNLNSVLQKATRSRRMKLHSVEWWSWSGPSHHTQYYLCSSLMPFTVVQFESGTALLRDKVDEGYHSWNRALLIMSRPWSLPNLLSIWENPQCIGKRDRGSDQPKTKSERFSITDYQFTNSCRYIKK